jgi:serine/threonine protein kinase
MALAPYTTSRKDDEPPGVEGVVELRHGLMGQASERETRMFMPNRLLKRRYRILKRVGQGGMGVVYKAEDLLFKNRLVAVKEMNPYGLPPAAVEAFEQEAYILAHLSHPNLPRMHDYFYEAGCSYLVMDFIEGESLEQYLERVPEGRLPLKETLQLGMKLCDVLQYLHSHQPPILFRDLKPANIMRTPAGEMFLIDFGIAGFFDLGRDRDTMAYGSIGYAAPERFGQLTTPQSDIYSLGAVLHQLLSGCNPATNTPNPFTFPPLLNVSTELKRLIEQMVQMDAANRPVNILAVKQELQQIALLFAGKSPFQQHYLHLSLLAYQSKENPHLHKLQPGPNQQNQNFPWWQLLS